MSEQHGLSRRGFVAGAVAFLGTVIGAVIGLPAIGYLLSPVLKKEEGTGAEIWQTLGSIDELTINVPRLYSFTRTKQVGWERTAASYGVYVVKKADGNLDVFSNVCTHLSCRVSWQDDTEEFVCPCHDGRFTIDGAIVIGPQPRPLDRYDYLVEAGELKIKLVEA